MRKKNKSDFKKKDWDKKDFSKKKKSDRFDEDKTSNRPFAKWKKDNPNFSKKRGSSSDRNRNSDRFEDRKSSRKNSRSFDKKDGSYKAYKQRGVDKLSKFSRFEKKKIQPVIKDNPALEELATKGMRLNKYVSNSGICSRRKADDFIKAGKVKVNDKIVLEMGHRVQKDDVVSFEGKVLNPESKVYVLLNKPKDMITTTEDPQGRPTVMDIVNNASEERLYPVGRLDRSTTGLLLLSNDGELAQRLTHPSYEMKKIYHVFLDKLFTKADFKKVAAGLMLEDGFAPIDDLAYPNPDDHKEVGIELHIGRNRIVRRIFESLGYKVKRLDRVIYGPLTKKDLPRGRWRYLSEKEVVLLKHFKE